MVLKGFILPRSRPIPTGSAEPDRVDEADGDGDGAGGGDAYDTYQRAVRARSRLLSSLGLRFDRLGWGGGIVRLSPSARRGGYTVTVTRDGDGERMERVVYDA